MLRLSHLLLLAAAACTAAPAGADTVIVQSFERAKTSEHWRKSGVWFGHEVRHHRRHWDSHDYVWTIPLAVGGLLLGYEALRDHEPRVIEHRYINVEPAEPEAHVWYWCESEQAYYPSVRACPLGWTEVTGSSGTTPPEPPSSP